MTPRRLTPVDRLLAGADNLLRTLAVPAAATRANPGDAVPEAPLDDTERQVVEHLEGHMRRLPEADERSRAILRAMARDEAEHGDAARAAGARRLPWAVRRVMRVAARVMTTTAYRI